MNGDKFNIYKISAIDGIVASSNKVDADLGTTSRQYYMKFLDTTNILYFITQNANFDCVL